MERSTGRRLDQLIAPEFNDAAQHLWDVWTDLQDCRQSGMGMGPLTYSEIDAYMRTTGAVIGTWEVKALRQIDRLFRSVFSG